LNIDGESKFEETNSIYMPGYKFIDFSYDNMQRLIFALAEIENLYDASI
jgi:hypothetical protein